MVSRWQPQDPGCSLMQWTSAFRFSEGSNMESGLLRHSNLWCYGISSTARGHAHPGGYGMPCSPYNRYGQNQLLSKIGCRDTCRTAQASALQEAHGSQSSNRNRCDQKWRSATMRCYGSSHTVHHNDLPEGHGSLCTGCLPNEQIQSPSKQKYHGRDRRQSRNNVAKVRYLSGTRYSLCNPCG